MIILLVADRFGHLVDVYAWNPHCRYLDGMGPSGKLYDPLILLACF